MCFESQDPVVCWSIRETVSSSDASCEKRTVAENCGKCEMCWDRSRVPRLCISTQASRQTIAAHWSTSLGGIARYLKSRCDTYRDT